MYKINLKKVGFGVSRPDDANIPYPVFEVLENCPVNGNRATSKVYYKVAKAGNVITLYYSINGKKWLLVRHLQFDLKSGFEIGFLAQSPTGTKCEVKFSDIKYQAVKIKDPYLGE